MTTPFDAADNYRAARWQGTIKLPHRQKGPPPTGFTGQNGAFPSDADILNWKMDGGGNIGLRLPRGVVGVDVDAYHPKTGADDLRRLEAKHGALPPTWISTSRTDGISGIRLYRVSPEIADWGDPAETDIECIWFGWRYVVAAPSVHPDPDPVTGEPRRYRWLKPDGSVAADDEYPVIDDLPWLPSEWIEPMTNGGTGVDWDSIQLDANGHIPAGQCHLHALQVSGDTARKVGADEQAIYDALVAYFDAHDRPGHKHDRADLRLQAKSTVRAVHNGKIVQVKFTGVGNPPAAAASASAPAGHGRFERSDAGNAEFFAAMYANSVRYDWRRQRWLVWDAVRWSPDNDGSVVRLGLDAMRRRQTDALSLSNTDERQREMRWAIGSESKQRLIAMLSIAQSLPPISDAGDRWDADPFLVGVPNGVVDLRTGTLRTAQPEDRITKQAGVAFDPTAICPLWDMFLDAVCSGDADVVRFIEDALGYSLTADMREQVFFLLTGTGGNGKSTLLDAIREVFGDYAVTSPFNTFTANRYGDGGPSNDLARLDGARFVTAIEPNEGATFHEGRVKELTGGDEVTARFLHKEFFTFKPSLKLWLATNHKPGVRDLSRGFWRRVRLVPFERDFEAEGIVDKTLGESLKAEAAGILASVVRAAVRWQRTGLIAPKAVTQAVEEYREEANPISDWINDRIDEVPGHWTSLADLHSDYRSWMADRWRSRETLGSRKFADAVEVRFKKRKTNVGQGFDGVRLAVLPHLKTIAEKEAERTSVTGDPWWTAGSVSR